MQNISGQIIGRYANNQPSGFLQKHASMPFREEVYEVQGSIRARWVTLSGRYPHDFHPESAKKTNGFLEDNFCLQENHLAPFLVVEQLFF